MIEFIIAHVFSSIWGWLGTAGIVVVGCAVVAWFFPSLRAKMLFVGGLVVSAAAIYAKGSRDAARRKQAEWDQAERDSIARGNTARADAQRDVTAGRVRDKFDRDDL